MRRRKLVAALAALTIPWTVHADDQRSAGGYKPGSRPIEFSESRWPGPNWFDSNFNAKTFLRDVLDSLPSQIQEKVRQQRTEIVVDQANETGECGRPYIAAVTVPGEAVRIVICRRGLRNAAIGSAIINLHGFMTLGAENATPDRALRMFAEDVAAGFYSEPARGFSGGSRCKPIEYVYAAIKELPATVCRTSLRSTSLFEPLKIQDFMIDSMVAAQERITGKPPETPKAQHRLSKEEAGRQIAEMDGFISGFAERIIGQYAALHELGHVAAGEAKTGKLSLNNETLADLFALRHAEKVLFPSPPRGAGLHYAKAQFEVATSNRYLMTAWREAYPPNLDERAEESIRTISCAFAVLLAMSSHNEILKQYQKSAFISKEMQRMDRECRAISEDARLIIESLVSEFKQQER